MPKWTIKKIKEWYAAQNYLFGANFYPSTAVNQLEMWQRETFDPETIEKELTYASKIGMNIMRVYLHDLLWEKNPEGFCNSIDKYLEIAEKCSIKTIFVIFDDCWNSEFALGKQPAPIPYTHNSGWVQSPGNDAVNDPQKWPRLEKYVKKLLTHYKDDQRIAFWDLYNEPGNGTNGDNSTQGKQMERSLPFLKAVFKWSRSVKGLTQPITSGIWSFSDSLKNINKFLLDNSDIITFHCYEPPQGLVNTIKRFSSRKRPIICTEYMARGVGSTFEHCLPVLKKYNIGAVNWGLVTGKTQTIYPWKWDKSKGDPDILFHDIFYPDGTFLYPNEELAIKQIIIGK